MNVSVGIVTRNRAASLERCLDALCIQRMPPFEILVVDNGSTDYTPALLRTYRTRLPMEVMREEKPGIPRCRNRCIRAAKGDVVAFTDDDCVPDPDWLERISFWHGRLSGAAAVGGIVRSGTNTLLARANQMMWESWLAVYRLDAGRGRRDIRFRLPGRIREAIHRPGWVRSLFTANASYKRGPLERLGGFNESLLTMSDEELNWRLYRSGYRLFYAPDIRVVHFHRETLAGFVRQHFRYGIGFRQTRSLHPEMPGMLPRSPAARLVLFPLLSAVQCACALFARPLSPDTLFLLLLTALAQAAFRCGILLGRERTL